MLLSVYQFSQQYITCIISNFSTKMEDIKVPMRRGRMEDIGDEEVLQLYIYVLHFV